MTNETLSFKCRNEEAYVKEEIKNFLKAKAASWPWFWCFYPVFGRTAEFLPVLPLLLVLLSFWL